MSAWPRLPYAEWKETYETLRLWLQIVGKVRLARSPWVNHQWHVTLYVTARGLTTSPIPHGTRSLALEPQPVSAFYRRVMALLDELGLPVAINRKPNELPQAIPFDQDDVHRAYEREHAGRPGRGRASRTSRREA